MAQTVKRLPAMQETQVRFLGREGPLEKEMAIQSSTLAWKIPWTEEPDRLQSMGSQSQTRLSDFTFTFTGRGDQLLVGEVVMDLKPCFQGFVKVHDSHRLDH